MVKRSFYKNMSKSLKEEAREKYFKIGEISAPAFPGEKITFNSKGFNHMFYKSPRRGRLKVNIACKVRLLDRAIELLEKSTVVQEEDSYTGTYRGKRKRYKFWAFEGVIKKRRIKVVVRQLGRGKKHFWSVIPAWRKSRFGVKNTKSNLKRI